MANRNIERAVRVTLLAAGAMSVGAYSSGAAAQAAGATPDEVEQIIVTGSRIPQPNIEGASPVTTIGAQDVQLQGITDTANLVNNLPQAFAAQGSQVSNGSSGTSTLNLRNLGSTRTLVLINGRRMPAGDPASISGISPDINMIPAPLIERVEVLTGGASAVYGSDAIAGVVNFIMKDDFEGVEMDGQYSFYNHYNGSGDREGVMKSMQAQRQFEKPPGTATDGDTYDLSILMGSNFADGKGNATMFLGYRHSDPVMQGDRVYSNCALQTAYWEKNPGQVVGYYTSTGDKYYPYANDPAEFFYGGYPLAAYGQGLGKFNAKHGARCGGSGTSAIGTFYDAANNFGGRGVHPYLGDPLAVPPIPGNPSVGVPGATAPYNYAPLNYFQRPDDRWSADVFMHYDVNDQVEAYAEFMFMDDHTVAQIAPSGIFSTYYDVPCNTSGDPAGVAQNPLISAQWLTRLCQNGIFVPNPHQVAGDPGYEDAPLLHTGSTLITGPYLNADGTLNPGTVPAFMQRRNVEGGPRQDDLRHTDYRGVVGIRGKVFEHWNYDLFGQYGTTILNEHVNNYVSNQRAAYALDVVANPTYDPLLPFDAVDNNPAACVGALAGYAPGCVPWDIWNPNTATSGVNAAALNYINVQGFSSGSTAQTIVNGSMSADLGDYGIVMPWATSGIGAAFGIEYRQEDLQLDYDIENITGDLGGGSGVLLPVKGGYNVMDYFVEARVPIVEDVAFAKSLVFNGSYRYSDYSTGINTNTYGLGLDWSPMDDFKLRGSFQHAVRAPNILELFTPQAVGLFDWAGDPCAGAAPSATLAQCQLTDGDNGNAAAWYGLTPLSPAGQYNANFGGNPNLHPETSDSWTAGIVLTPTFFEGFTMTMDYFNIEVTDVISSVPPSSTVANCVNGDLTFCSQIHRTASGSLWTAKDGFVDAISQNLGFYKTTGVDFNVNYNLPLGDWGGLNFNELATWLDSFTVQEVPGFGDYECKGFYGPTCGTPLPEWKSKFQTIWSMPWNVDLSLTWRYVDAVTLDTYSKDCDLGCDYTTQKPFDKTLDSQNYFDLGATFTFADHYTMNAGINNIFDESPPISSNVGTGFGNGNTYPQVYDAMGRYIFIGMTAKF